MRASLRMTTAVALCAALTPIATAADQPVWTGLHVGVNAAYADYRSTWTDLDYDWNGGSLTWRTQGAILGAQVGYDQQIGRLVLGAAFEWDRPALSASWRYADDDNVENNAREIRTLRLRAGVTADQTLFYLVGGFAKGKFEHQWEEDADPTDSWPRFVNQNTGYVLGFGVEQLVTSHVSARFELLNYDFGEVDSTNENGYTMRVKDEILAIRLGGSYRF